MHRLLPLLIAFVFSLCLALLPAPVWATVAAGSSVIPGASLSLWWALPFGGMLASLALLPLLAPHFWEAHYGKVALGWSLCTTLSLTIAFGMPLAQGPILGTFFHHYLPFIIMIGALYTISGGIHLEIDSPATPLVNTTLLAIGTFLAGWIGTTGASMLLIRPLLHINRHRTYHVHQVIFFIFLIGNIGGALTPLGDPPLFIGFLNGVPFSWPLENLALQTFSISLVLLILFYVSDSYFAFREGGGRLKSVRPRMKVKGSGNGFLFLCVIGLVVFSGLWTPDVHVIIGGVSFELQHMVRDVALVGVTLLSWFLTPAGIHKANAFSWEPLAEVIKLFFGIFMTVIPVVAILDAGLSGAMAPLIALVDQAGHPQNAMYFWLSGGLSAFLDNAPTYLVFFHMAGGEASVLTSTFARTLEAISLGAVFMGAMTYIGNAPNFMVKAIAERHKIKMPSFFGYMAWSLGILLPLFILLSWWRF